MYYAAKITSDLHDLLKWLPTEKARNKVREIVPNLDLETHDYYVVRNMEPSGKLKSESIILSKESLLDFAESPEFDFVFISFSIDL